MMRFTNRDNKIFDETSMSVFSLRQLKKLHFANIKVASRRMKKLSDAGFIKRMPMPFNDNNGRAEYIYSMKPIKDVFSIPHCLMISDIYIAFSLVNDPDYKVSFYYPNQLGLNANNLAGLIPDAIVVIEKPSTQKALLNFIEADCGSETLRSKKGFYSIDHKIDKYLRLFNNESTMEWVKARLEKTFRGFRVLFSIKGNSRLSSIKRICRQKDAEFIWLADESIIAEGNILGSIWCNYKYEKLSLLAPYPPVN